MAQTRPARVPLATYRLQFNRQFTFAQAAQATNYLHQLGISDVYASPLFRACPQSTHGYDVCGFDQFNPNAGTADDFEGLTQRLARFGMGLLLDMVPNHMGADSSNQWWQDVLKRGRASPYASWFDIDWQPPHSEFPGKVLLPILEDHYLEVLEAGKLKLVSENGGLALACYDRRFPLAPESYRLLVEQIPALRTQVGGALAKINGQPGEPASFNVLDQLLRRQHYRLAWWRVGPEEINYRRFFDVTELVCLRMELEEVFQSTHALVFRLIKQGKVTGLRIDHPDGLWNPKQYFERLQAAAREITPPSSRTDGSRPPARSFYIVAEKILTQEELLPADWPVAGTTGYDFLNRLNGLFVQRANEPAFNDLYHQFTGCSADFAAAMWEGKSQVLRSSFVSELNGLVRRLKSITIHTRAGRDLTWSHLHKALSAIIAAFPVYRTYITAETKTVTRADRAAILDATRSAKARNPGADVLVFDFIEKLLLLEAPEELDEAGRKSCREWVMCWQQLTGPVMAKGLEDTAFYNFNRLISLNEVGGDPGTFGTAPGSFHAYNQMKAQKWPHSLLATATHDTKRGEDLRARLNVLSEIPQQWGGAVRHWSELNAHKKTVLDGASAPHANDEYLFYQVLVGAWTAEAESADGLRQLRERLSAYMLKAIKEAKRHTSWTEPNLAYEKATLDFVEGVLANSAANPFLDEFRNFQRQIAFYGVFNSLSQVLLKLTSPGVPDFYQGTELWDFNLVDPDNRRPVDYELRRQLLADLKRDVVPEQGGDPVEMRAFLADLLRDVPSGRIKLYLIWRLLRFRRQHRAIFDHGQYLPLLASGAKAGHVCAFARAVEGKQVIIVAPRLVHGLTEGGECPPMGEEIWQDTHLLPPRPAAKSYRNVVTGEILSPTKGSLLLADVLKIFPVAVVTNIT